MAELTDKELAELRGFIAEQKIAKGNAMLEQLASHLATQGLEIAVGQGPTGPHLSVRLKPA